MDLAAEGEQSFGQFQITLFDRAARRFIPHALGNAFGAADDGFGLRLRAGDHPLGFRLMRIDDGGGRR